MDNLYRLKHLTPSQEKQIDGLVTGLADDGLDSLVAGLARVVHEADKAVSARLDSEDKKDRPGVGELSILAKGFKTSRDNLNTVYDHIKARLWKLQGSMPGKSNPKDGIFFRFTRPGIQRTTRYGQLKKEFPTAYRQCVVENRAPLNEVGTLYFTDVPNRHK